MPRAQPRELTLSLLPKLLTANDVAVWLKTTRKAVYAMVERAQLPVVRVGTRVLFREDEMVAWLEKRRAESPGGRR